MQKVFNAIVIFFVGLSFFLIGTPNKDEVCMIGHRGYSSRYADNTEQSFIAAAKHGSKGVETDVRTTKDGVLVLSHDSVAEFKDGTKLVVAESTYAELTAKPLKNTKNRDTVYLCTFERYLEICKEYNLICFIELKGTFNDELIISAFSMADEIYDLSMCSLQSFNADNLIRAHELFPELQIMLTAGSDDDYSVCFEYGFDIDIDYTGCTKELVEKFHEAGLKVGVWTCNNAFSYGYGHWVGADYVESDVF